MSKFQQQELYIQYLLWEQIGGRCDAEDLATQ